MFPHPDAMHWRISNFVSDQHYESTLSNQHVLFLLPTYIIIYKLQSSTIIYINLDVFFISKPPWLAGFPSAQHEIRLFATAPRPGLDRETLWSGLSASRAPWRCAVLDTSGTGWEFDQGKIIIKQSQSYPLQIDWHHEGTERNGFSIAIFGRWMRKKNAEMKDMENNGVAANEFVQSHTTRNVFLIMCGVIHLWS